MFEIKSLHAWFGLNIFPIFGISYNWRSCLASSVQAFDYQVAKFYCGWCSFNFSSSVCSDLFHLSSSSPPTCPSPQWWFNGKVNENLVLKWTHLKVSWSQRVDPDFSCSIEMMSSVDTRFPALRGTGFTDHGNIRSFSEWFCVFSS